MLLNLNISGKSIIKAFGWWKLIDNFIKERLEDKNSLKFYFKKASSDLKRKREKKFN